MILLSTPHWTLLIVIVQLSHMIIARKSSPDITKTQLKEDCDEQARNIVVNLGNEDYNTMKKEVVPFFKDCIVEMFQFEMEASPNDKDPENFNRFKSVPTFEEPEFKNFNPLDSKFGLYAKVIEQFFTRAGEWNRLLNDKSMIDTSGPVTECKNLLYSVAAKYVYFTHILWVVSRKKISLCQVDEMDDNQKVLLPKDVCYPIPIETMTCTSDTDVGLIGKDAVSTVQRYVNHINSLTCGDKGDEELKCNSEVMLDQDLYTYSLQLATPELFESKVLARSKKLQEQKKILTELDKSFRFKWLDILLAMMQVSHQRATSFYEKFQRSVLEKDVKNKKLEDYSKQFLMTATGSGGDENRKAYDVLVKYIQQEDLGEGVNSKMQRAVFHVLRSQIKSSDSYRSFGALRTIVVTMLMKRRMMINRLSLNDYIASAIENYGYSFATLNKCSSKSYVCIGDSSKYLWRVYVCLKAAKDILLNLGEGEQLSEDARSDIHRSRDYLLELYHIFNKNGEEVPAKYFSPLSYREDMLSGLDDESKKDGLQKEEKEASDLQKKYLKCDSIGDCKNTIENIIIEYTKAAVRYQQSMGDGSKKIIDKTVNENFFNYVTANLRQIDELYKSYFEEKEKKNP